MPSARQAAASAAALCGDAPTPSPGRSAAPRGRPLAAAGPPRRRPPPAGAAHRGAPGRMLQAPTPRPCAASSARCRRCRPAVPRCGVEQQIAGMQARQAARRVAGRDVDDLHAVRALALPGRDQAGMISELQSACTFRAWRGGTSQPSAKAWRSAGTNCQRAARRAWPGRRRCASWSGRNESAGQQQQRYQVETVIHDAA